MNQTYNVSSLILPKGGPVILTASVDLTTEASALIDITAEISQGHISHVQGIFVDNWDGAQALEIVADVGPQQRLVIPANSQVWLPYFVTGTKFTITAAASPAIVVPVIFYNIPLQPLTLINSGGGVASDVNVTGGTLDAVTAITDPITVTSITDPVDVVLPAAGAIADQSLALDGTNQTLFLAGEASEYAFIYSPSTNAADMVVNLAGGDATVSGVTIPPGGSFELTVGCSNAITIAGTLGDDVVAYGR